MLDVTYYVLLKGWVYGLQDDSLARRRKGIGSCIMELEGVGTLDELRRKIRKRSERKDHCVLAGERSGCGFQRSYLCLGCGRGDNVMMRSGVSCGEER